MSEYKLNKQKGEFNYTINTLQTSIKRYGEGFSDRLSYGDYETEIDKKELEISRDTINNILKLFFN